MQKINWKINGKPADALTVAQEIEHKSVNWFCSKGWSAIPESSALGDPILLTILLINYLRQVVDDVTKVNNNRSFEVNDLFDEGMACYSGLKLNELETLTALMFVNFKPVDYSHSDVSPYNKDLDNFEVFDRYTRIKMDHLYRTCLVFEDKQGWQLANSVFCFLHNYYYNDDNSRQETNYLLKTKANRETLTHSINQLDDSTKYHFLTPEEFGRRANDD